MPQATLALAQHRLGLLALGDVDARSDVADEPLALRVAGDARIENPAEDAIIPPQTIFHLERAPLEERFEVRFHRSREVFGVDPFRPPVAELLVHRAARELEPAAVEERAFRVLACHPQEDRR